MDFKKIKTYEDACAALKLNPNSVPDFSMIPEEEQAALIAHAKLVVIAKAANGDWKPNWNDNGERKFYPWFDMEAGDNNPSGFSLGGVYVDGTYTYVGSRLCYKSREIAEHVANTFLELYKAYMVKS